MIDSKSGLIELRHRLHQNAELSNYEIITSSLIKDYVIKFNPDRVIRFNHGLAYVWDSHKQGETIMFRADMDALPISEETNLLYFSRNPHVSHSCGHDGHIAILCGLAEKISNDLPQTGKVVLLFQPAEEIGEGAYQITENSEFKSIEPDKIFALHNVPGYSKKKILIKEGSFACASRGMIIKLFGRSSHAAEPENGINPVFAISKLIDRLYRMIKNKADFTEFTSLTVVYIKLGEIAFGTSPGYAELMLTLRSENNEDMCLLISKSSDIVNDVCREEELTYDIDFTEIFPAVVNSHECLKILNKSVDMLNLKMEELPNPFKWSEDFSYFTNKYSGAFFGIGAGIKQANLHNPDYDFPDDIIDTGIEIFYQIYRICLGKE